MGDGRRLRRRPGRRRRHAMTATAIGDYRKTLDVCVKLVILHMSTGLNRGGREPCILKRQYPNSTPMIDQRYQSTIGFVGYKGFPMYI